MAYQDALFQLGMDLTRSSTAQKEDHGETACVARDVAPESDFRLRKQTEDTGRFQDRVVSGFSGSHLVIDLFGALRLDDADHIEKTLKQCAALAGAQLLHVHLNPGAPDEGVSGFAAVAGGHLAIHTHPVTGTAALDVFVRGEVKSARVVDVLEKAFSASRVVVRKHTRGEKKKVLSQSAVPVRSRGRVRKAA